MRARTMAAWAALLMGLAVASRTAWAQVPENPDGLLHCTLGGGRSIVLDVQMGTLTNRPVTVRYDEGISVLAQRDDQSFSMHPGENILEESGAYQLLFTLSSEALEQGSLQPGELTSYSVTFVIQTTPVGLIKAVSPPPGYSISRVQCDGQTLTDFSANQLFLEQDGRYSITFSRGSQLQQLELILDTIPPLLTFNGGTATRFTQNHVVVACTEPDVLLDVTRDGSPYFMKDNTLSGTGIYLLRVTDAAKNQTTYTVRLLQAGVVDPRGIILFLVLLAGLGAGYYLWYRTSRLIVR